MSPTRKVHILLASFPAFGHIIPIVELAKKIKAHYNDYTVTFAVSDGKLAEIAQRKLITESDAIVVYGIPDGVVDDFDNPGDQSVIGRIFEGVLPSVAQLIAEMPTRTETGKTLQPVDVVIADIFLGGVVTGCRSRNVPYYLFDAANASFLLHTLLTSDDTPTCAEADVDSFMRLPEPGCPMQPFTERMKVLIMGMRSKIHLANGILINSFREVEEDSLREVVKDLSMKNLTVHCVGPLLPDMKILNSDSQNPAANDVLNWLSGQAARSVVYVSFGSVATPTPAQITEIGIALLALKRPFIWSLRGKFHQFLPEGITKIMNKVDKRERPFLMVEWAPQKAILQKASVAVFLSHCGWNSTLEALSSRKPIVAWPMFADQLMNAQWMGKLGASVLIPDTGIKCPRIVPAEEISHTIRQVGGWTEGQDDSGPSAYLVAAQTWGDKINKSWTKSGSSYKEFTDLLQCFVDGKKNAPN